MHRAQLIAGCDATRSDASKDFFDPVKQRRINWGWLTTTDYGVQSLPRELHYHPVLKQLTFNPVEEQDQLPPPPLRRRLKKQKMLILEPVVSSMRRMIIEHALSMVEYIYVQAPLSVMVSIYNNSAGG